LGTTIGSTMISRTGPERLTLSRVRQGRESDAASYERYADAPLRLTGVGIIMYAR
jgi:hypothetical protein